MMYFYLIILCLLCFIYLKLKYNMTYWERKQVQAPTPHLLFGNLVDVLLGKKHFGEVYTDIYTNPQYQNCRYVGCYKAQNPALILRDIDLVKSVMVKDFDYFYSNGVHVDAKIDPIAASSAFVLTGAKWKTRRQEVLKCFAMSKIKTLLPMIDENGNVMMTYIDNEIKETGNHTFNIKDICSRYVMDNIGSCGFGIDAQSFKVDDDPKLLKYGKKIFERNFFDAMKLALAFIEPRLIKYFKIEVTPSDSTEYFLKSIVSAVKYRQENHIVRHNIFHFMTKDKALCVDDIALLCATFFVEGFESTSCTLSLIFYNIAKHMDVQIKLRKEVHDILRKYNGEVNAEAINEMTYLDKVYLESQRINPGGLNLMKICMKKYTLPPCDYNNKGNEVICEPGTSMIIPLHGLYHDPRYFDEPDTFKPERFDLSEGGNKMKRIFFPFGTGPRSCLGKNFAVMVLKMAMIKMVQNYEIRLNEKMNRKIEIDPKFFVVNFKGGILIDLHRRLN